MSLHLTFLILNTIFLINNPSLSLKDESKLNNTEEIVYTPFGFASKSRIHYVNNNQALNILGDSIQIIEIRTNKINQSIASNQLKSPSEYYKHEDGWMTYAYCQVTSPMLLSVEYIVPSPPKENNNQLLYLFSGLQGDFPRNIIQPVLQWGISPAGGGDYWAICNWFVTESDFFYDSLIKVFPGDKLKAIIKRDSSENNLYSFISYFDGYSKGLQVYSVFDEAYGYEADIAFETYNVFKEAEYPMDEKISFRNISLQGSERDYFKWSTYNSPKNDQYTKIISNNNKAGIIDIYFHSPVSINGFDEIHFYPNPVRNNLHISSGWIEHPVSILPDIPITKCYIELINLSGLVLYRRKIELFDFEFDLDMSSFETGIYFIRFSYNNKIHSFKLIKE